MFQVFEDGIQKKVVVDDEPFTETKMHFANAKFYLKDQVLVEVKLRTRYQSERLMSQKDLI